MKKLNTVVVGGGMGGHLSLWALNESDKFEVIAAADINSEACAKLENEFPGIKTFTSYEEMFSVIQPDVVCVSTYAPSHEQITLEALKYNIKGILVEKPLGHTASSAANIVSSIKAKKIPMAVPHGLRAKAASLEVVKKVVDGEIGELKMIDIQCAGWDIFNAGIHWLDFAMAITSNKAIDSVLAICDTSAKTFRDGMKVETTAVTYITNADGVRIVMQTGDFIKTNTPEKGALIRVIGTKGIIEYWPWEDSYYILNKAHPSGKIVEVENMPVNGHQFHLENMAAMIESISIDYSVAEGSLMALEIVEATYLSSKYKAEIKFPLKNFIPSEPNDWDAGQPYDGIGGGRNGREL